MAACDKLGGTSEFVIQKYSSQFNIFDPKKALLSHSNDFVCLLTNGGDLHAIPVFVSTGFPTVVGHQVTE